MIPQNSFFNLLRFGNRLHRVISAFSERVIRQSSRLITSAQTSNTGISFSFSESGCLFIIPTGEHFFENKFIIFPNLRVSNILRMLV